MTRRATKSSGGSEGLLHPVNSVACLLDPSEISDICTALQEDQIYRKWAIQNEVSAIQRVSALVVRLIGLETDADESTRKAAWVRAERIVRRGLNGKPQDAEDAKIAAVLAEPMKVAADTIAPATKFRSVVEARMAANAARLPGFALTERTPGFKAIGLAVIVGEAGNLSNYATVRKLWRRLGFGMAQGHEAHAYSTWRMKGGLTGYDWTVAGYSPKRLGQIYGVVTVPLAMNKAKSRYGDVYAARRAHTAATHPTGTLAECKADPARWTLGHSHADALRVMTKALISDLWSEWRGSERHVAGTSEFRLAPASSILEASVA